MRRKSLEHAVCPIARSLDSIGDWWSLLLVRDAVMGKRRFGEFQRSLGLAKNILAARLRKLVACGIFRLEPASDGSGYREYVLTQKGEALRVVLASMRFWGTHWLFGNDPQAPTVRDRATREEVVGIGFRTRSGRLLLPADLEFVTAPVRPARGRRRARAVLS